MYANCRPSGESANENASVAGGVTTSRRVTDGSDEARRTYNVTASVATMSEVAAMTHATYSRFPRRVVGAAETACEDTSPRHQTEQTMAKQITNGDALRQAILRESMAWPLR
jgi:hypothetical protein